MANVNFLGKSKTASPGIIYDSQQLFNFPVVAELTLKRKTSFLNGLALK